CFLGNNEIGSFLETHGPRQIEEGPILSTAGQLLGTHRGLFRYTIGQRKGLGIASSAPLYVTCLDVKRNAVIVGSNEELFRNRIDVAELHWLGTPPDTTRQYTVRIRYSHPGSKATLALHENANACGTIVFDEPQRAITPGQFAVIYDGTELLGSGVIVSAVSES
ncbi:MAG: hypothetical protein ACD_75C01019G0001, partial [uncultured bacterium]